MLAIILFCSAPEWYTWDGGGSEENELPLCDTCELFTTNHAGWVRIPLWASRAYAIRWPNSVYVIEDTVQMATWVTHLPECHCIAAGPALCCDPGLSQALSATQIQIWQLNCSDWATGLQRDRDVCVYAHSVYKYEWYCQTHAVNTPFWHGGSDGCLTASLFHDTIRVHRSVIEITTSLIL